MKIMQSIALVMFACVMSAQAQNPTDDVQDAGWPRAFDTDEYNIIVYQPQVDEWPNFERITFRAAFSIARKGKEDRAYGTIRVSGATNISKTDRLVLISDRKIEDITFPDVPAADAERLKAAVTAVSPKNKSITLSLDRIVPQLDVNQVKVREVNVNLAPPKIIASDKPAVLVIFMGKPRFKPVTSGNLQFAINTNWDVFFDKDSSKYYLLNGKSWLVTDNLEKGPWASATALPGALTALPADDNWSDVRAAIPLAPAKEAPVVFVSNEPAELIVTEGSPQFQPIPDTKLMLVVNTESNLIFNPDEKQYYLLVAGRWFKAGEPAGPWKAASADLPEDFKKIPEDSDAADVLASVPGTDAAKDAVIMASIPQKATINRADVTVNVTYDGPPQFKPIEKTTVQYAYNTPFNVFLVEGKYYCCHDAVWFISPQPTGTWVVCDSVPAAIYSIPPTSPKYNVTYVTINESTPTTVETSYTAGYNGETVAATGALMFGMGMLVGAAIENNDDYWGYCYPACYYSYGCGSHYLGGCGGYVAGGAVYGPYGGAGRYAAYNPGTGTYSRGAAVYGPNGAAGYRTAYNPSTGNAGYRAGGGNAYSSWGRAGVTNGEDWVRGGYKSGPGGSVGAIQGSDGAAAVHRENRYGNGTTVARNQEGDVYAGKDGNVYKKTDDGWAQQTGRNRSRETQSTRTGQTSVTRQQDQTSTARQSAQAPANRSPAAPQSAAARQAPPQAGNLQREATNRNRGEMSASRTQQFQKSGGQAASRGGGARGSGQATPRSGGSRGGGRR
jgi:hypothetical protein